MKDREHKLATVERRFENLKTGKGKSAPLAKGDWSREVFSREGKPDTIIEREHRK